MFDIADFETELDKYKVVILPDIVRVDNDFAEKLRRFCNNGGKILATGKSAMYTDKNEFCLELGAKWLGENQYKPDYFRPFEEIAGMGDTDYVMYGSGEKICCIGVELGSRKNPYFNRTWEHFCSHQHTPCGGEYGGGGMTEGKDGIYIAWNIFDDYAETGGIHLKQMAVFALDKLLGSGKTLITSLPAQGITTLMQQENRLICHLLYVSPVKRGRDTEVIEDIIPIYNTNLKIKTDMEIRRVYLAPQNKDIEFQYKDGVVSMSVEEIECHQMIVLE